MTKELTDKEFDPFVKDASLPVLVDFWAPWCGPCRMIAPRLEELSKEMEDKLSVCKMNIDENAETATNYGVMSIPTLVILKDGKEVARHVGSATKEKLKEWVGGFI